MVHKKIIAHRGASHDRRENTFESFDLAIHYGVDAIELDVQQTLDQQLVVYHDKKLPTTNETLISDVQYRVAKEILSTENVQLPLLSEVIEHFQGKTFFDIELKEGVNPFHAVTITTSYLATNEFQLKSFNVTQLEKIREITKCINTALILDYRWYPQIRLFKDIKKCNPNQIHLHWKEMIKYFNLLKWVKLPIWVWTIDSPEALCQFLIDSRVEGIITNEPLRALNFRDLFSF